MTEILSSHAVRVSDVGETVVVEFGDFSRTLDFVTALELAALIKRGARYARASAGDEGVRRNVAAVLHDAAAAKRKGPHQALPERLLLKEIRVLARGQVVSVHLGRAEIGLPYVAAGKISQWIRIHAKLARNSAGEKAHWSQLVRPETLQGGARA